MTKGPRGFMRLRLIKYQSSFRRFNSMLLVFCVCSKIDVCTLTMSEIINPIMNKIGYPGSKNFETNINGILPPELFIHCIFKYLDLQGLHCAIIFVN